MKTKDSITFEEMYFEEMRLDPYAKKYYCYLRAEGKYITMTGGRKYKNWATFRKVLSIRRKNRKENQSNAETVNNIND